MELMIRLASEVGDRFGFKHPRRISNATRITAIIFDKLELKYKHINVQYNY